jgi:hypothetical protein
MMKSTRFTLPLTAVILLLAGTAYAAPLKPMAMVPGSDGQAAPMGGKPAPTPPPKPIGPPKSGDE